MRDGFFCSQPGVGADLQLGEFLFTGRVALAQQRAEDCAEKSQRDAENAGIFQREKWRVLNYVAGRRCDGWRVHGHDARTNKYQRDRSEESGGKSGDGARGVETLPENRKQDHWKIRGSSDRECQGDEERDVCRGTENNGKGDGNRADDERGDARDAAFFTGIVVPGRDG